MKIAADKLKIAKAVFGLAGLLVVVLAFAYGGNLLDTLQRGHGKLEAILGNRLHSKHGLVFLADFNASIPKDAISGGLFKYLDVPRVIGKFGQARRIDLEKSPHLETPATPHLTSMRKATFMAWFRPLDTKRNQTLFGIKDTNNDFSLALANEQLVFSFHSGTNYVTSSCKFAGKQGLYSHVALAIGKNYVAIFQNGNETSRIEIDSSFSIPAKPLVYGVDTHHPFEGDIDDLAIYKFPLEGSAIRRIAKSKCGILRFHEPLFAFLADSATMATDLTANTYKAICRLFPPLQNPAQIAKGIPKITIWPSKNDMRHFIKAHEESIHSGYRTTNAASFRTVDISIEGKSFKAEVALDDIYGLCNNRRMAFIVKDPTRSFSSGSGVFRLYPPETHETFHPDSPYPLPLSASFVRLYQEDSFLGLYVIEDFDRTGGAWMARGRRDPSFPNALYFHSNPSKCDFPPNEVDPEDAFAETARLALSDTLFPWSRQEIRARGLALHRRRHSEMFDFDLNNPPIDWKIINGNPSLMFVTNDLALNQDGISWVSSNPNIVSNDGRVHRPQNGAPVPVELTPTFKDGTKGNPVRLRVAPYSPALPTLFIYIGQPIEKHHRRDFSCMRIPAGEGAPEWITGFSDSDGGIKHRGNTSYVKGAKRSVSLCFDQKVSLPTSSNDARHLLLLSGYADATRLRNKISFESYRIASANGGNYGLIDISWSEVFINGEYFGLWETCGRVKDVCDANNVFYKVRAFNANLWKTTKTDMTEFVNKYTARSNPYADLESLFEFTSYASPESFARQVDKLFSIESIVNYTLMLNFTENFDGQVTNQYIGRRKRDGKWFIIPWDYDKTFFDGDRFALTNPLIYRMYTDYPGFKDKLADKWASLRSGPMADEAVLGRIGADAALLAPYMEEEYRLLKPAGWDKDFTAAVSQLKEVVSARLKRMDAIYKK